MKFYNKLFFHGGDLGFDAAGNIQSRRAPFFQGEIGVEKLR
jgi:hypothetical protein